MKKKVVKVIKQTKSYIMQDGILTLSAKAYTHLDKKFTDLTKVTIKQALIEINKFLKSQL